MISHWLWRAGVVSAALFGAAGAASAQSLDLGNLDASLGTGVVTAPVGIVNAPGDSTDRLFVVEQTGRISIVTFNRTVNPPTNTRVTFLDVSASLVPSGGTFASVTVEDTPFGPTRTQTGPFNRVRLSEQGLLGLAFHPDYNTPGALNEGVFYINYTGPRGVYGYSTQDGLCWDLGETRIVRYRRLNANAADTTTAKTILTVAQPYWNHNGGQTTFGPDRMLYIGMGDGGSGGDPNNFAQNLNSRLGKILRIDPSLQAGDVWASFNFRVPADNPYAAGGGAAEIWAVGVRNPWRFSFDRWNGDLYIADVGQNIWEEINWVAGNGGPRRNYQWRRLEGFATYSGGTSLAAGTVSTNPVYDYPHQTNAAWPEYTSAMTGASVTGGFCYRGKAIPGWRGRYFFSDYVQPRIWSVRMVNGVATDFQIHTTQLATSPAWSNITTWGEDNAGELYIALANGRIRKLVPQLPQPSLADVAQASGAPGPDGFLTGADFDFFVAAFLAGDQLADIATAGSSDPAAGPDGFITGDDFDMFVVLFFQ